jgi:hypothetical protein
MDAEHRLLALVPFDDGHEASHDHVEVAAGIALTEKHFARLRPPPLAMAGQNLDLRIAEPRIGAMDVRRLRD